MKASKIIPYLIITYLIIVILILVIFLQRECKNCPEKPNIQDSVIYQVDTITLKNTVYFPKPYKVIDTLFQHDTIFKNHYDTVQAVKDYSLYRKYDLPLFNDSIAKVDLVVDVQFNQIAKYQVKGTIYDRKTIIEHHTFVREEKRNKVFFGAKIGYSIPDTSMLVAPTLQFLTKKEHLYSISYEPFRKIAEVGVFWKIKLKK